MIRRFCLFISFAFLALPLSVQALEPVRGYLLVAADSMADPRFQETVILLLRHDGGGSFGLVLNRPTQLPLSEAIPGSDVFHARDDMLWLGGPVEPGQPLVLTAGDDVAGRRIIPGVKVATVAGLVDTLQRGGKATPFRVFAGHAGWAPGQLAGEVARGDWQVLPATAELVFGDAGTLWYRLSDGTRPFLALSLLTFPGGPAARLW